MRALPTSFSIHVIAADGRAAKTRARSICRDAGFTRVQVMGARRSNGRDAPGFGHAEGEHLPDRWSVHVLVTGEWPDGRPVCPHYEEPGFRPDRSGWRTQGWIPKGDFRKARNFLIFQRGEWVTENQLQKAAGGGEGFPANFERSMNLAFPGLLEVDAGPHGTRYRCVS